MVKYATKEFTIGKTALLKLTNQYNIQIIS